MLAFLGFDAKPNHFAWMSFFILVSTCGYSIFSFHKIENQKSQFYNSAPFQNAIQARVELTQLHCLHHRMNCDHLVSLAKSHILFESSALTKIYKKNFGKKDVGTYLLNLLQNGVGEENQWDMRDLKYVQLYWKYYKLKNDALQAYNSFVKTTYLLTQNSIRPLTLVRSLFLHQGWIDLLFNMFFFLAFSMFVEARLGGFLTLLVYVLGGMVGLVIQVKLYSDPTVNYVGASGSVAAMLGAALSLFSGKRVKILLSLVVYSKTFLIPAVIALPLILVAHDVIGNLMALHSAHVVYVASFCSGILIAQLLAAVDAIPREFLFPEEYRLFRVFKTNKQFRTQTLALKKILNINPDNHFVIAEAAKWFTVEVSREPLYFKNHISFISQMIGAHVKDKLNEESHRDVVKYLSHLPVGMNYKAVFKYVPLNIQLAVQDEWLLRGKLSLFINENLELEAKLPPSEAHRRWNKIMHVIEAELTHISTRERDEIVKIYEENRMKNPDHVYLTKLGEHVKLLKERSLLHAA